MYADDLARTRRGAYEAARQCVALAPTPTNPVSVRQERCRLQRKSGRVRNFEYVFGITIGIDLGTSSSCVGIWRSDGVEMIRNEVGKLQTPSCVAFTGAFTQPRPAIGRRALTLRVPISLYE